MYPARMKKLLNIYKIAGYKINVETDNTPTICSFEVGHVFDEYKRKTSYVKAFCGRSLNIR